MTKVSDTKQVEKPISVEHLMQGEKGGTKRPNAHIVHAKQFLVLLTKSIFRLCEDLYESKGPICLLRAFENHKQTEILSKHD